MTRYETTRRLWQLAALALCGVLFLLTSPAVAQSEDDDVIVDRRVTEKVNRIVIDDENFHVVPCEDIESEHPDAVRRSRRGYLGVELTSLTDELLRHFGVAGDGVMVSKVTDGSPAQRSGLQVGDIISRFDGRTIESTRDLGRRVRDQPGRTAVAEVWRDGKVQNLSVTVGEREMCSLDLGALMDDLDFDFNFEGLDIDTEELGRVAAELGSRGAELGLRVAEEVTRAMSEIDWEQQMETMEELTELEEERMEALQERLEELEKRMEKEYERFGEEYERKMEEAMRQKERALRAQERALEERLEAQTQERRERVEEQAARAEARRAEAEQRALEAEERIRAQEARRVEREKARAEAEAAEDAEEGDGGGETLDV